MSHTCRVSNSGSGSGGWQDAPWESSLSHSSLSQPDEAVDQPPNPFSREGSDSADGLGRSEAAPASAASPTEPAPSAPQIPAAEAPAPPIPAPPILPAAQASAPPMPVAPQPAPADTSWPGYPPAAPSDGPAPYAPPAPGYPQRRSEPGFDRQPTPAYGIGSNPTSYPSAPNPTSYPSAPNPTSYPSAPNPSGNNAYGPPTAEYQQPPANPYGSNPYAVNPYQPSYGGYGSYGVAPTRHPRAVLALVLGIISVVFASACVGGVIGIPAIMISRKTRSEMDATPGRYTGRGMATAGLVMGIFGVVLSVLFIIAFVTTGVMTS